MNKFGELAAIAGAATMLAACSSEPVPPLAARPMTPAAEDAMAASPRTGTAPSGTTVNRATGGAMASAPAVSRGAAAEGAMASSYRTGTAPPESPTASGSTRPADRIGAGDSDFSDDTGAEATKALNMLVSSGHGDFADFRRHGDDFVADVRHQGQRLAVLVDPDTGSIMRLPGAR